MGSTTTIKSPAEPVFNQFASDNYAGICPQAWEAMERANHGFSTSYGDDCWTERACECIRELFETDCQVFFVFNGTAANSLALASLCRSYHSVLCHDLAHVETDECGAPEFFSNGTKILHIPGADGKLDLEAVEHAITRRSDIHYPKPRVLSLTQSTEVGTVYSREEIGRAAELAHRYGLRVQMDGARFTNAVASLGVAPAEITWKAGVDVLCLGGAKNGMAVGEAVVFFNGALAEEFEYRCKQAGQLASKMRFISAPWIGLLESGAWLGNAEHANRHARLLADKLADIPGISLMHPCQANSVFVEMPPATAAALRDAGWRFYSFIGSGGARFMCSWQTTEDDVNHLVAAIRQATGR
ncbi:low specificity L-threonine aldolase [Geobacter sp. SVR]|uniref:threonine aldolase family protein n=1 Tax=Geobacter sp. SVR TaxID=2495594 RepID=UPI00143EFF6A|nr:low specificity L-threonine aldolase [Geobacter sp. SVR]BCS55879.1 L-threonine aldolase [Geobacter sp. SVR]GCF83883.1 L-threonine aldolase [Geobacter sp. SVR]